MKYNIFISKESRAGELRVSLIPQEALALIKQGHKVFVEKEAGLGAGYSDEDYQEVGVKVTEINEDSLDSYQSAFLNINLIVRAKRPNRAREQLENQALQRGTIIIGALDPLERGSNHIAEYHAAGLLAYSIDQAILAADDPMNVLASMSKLAGKLALLDAIAKCSHSVNKVSIIGFGVVGRAALAEALQQQLHCSVIVGNQQQANDVVSSGGIACIVDRSLALEIQQEKILQHILTADIIMSAARKSNQQAPLLIPESSLAKLKPGAVVIDMAISEGGNVFGSKHDATITLDNKVMITNVSGYPKARPHEASLLWSQASFHFISQLAEQTIKLKPC